MGKEIIKCTKNNRDQPHFDQHYKNTILLTLEEEKS